MNGPMYECCVLVWVVCGHVGFCYVAVKEDHSIFDPFSSGECVDVLSFLSSDSGITCWLHYPGHAD